MPHIAAMIEALSTEENPVLPGQHAIGRLLSHVSIRTLV